MLDTALCVADMLSNPHDQELSTENRIQEGAWTQHTSGSVNPLGYAT
jgi:hypothetical protein